MLTFVLCPFIYDALDSPIQELSVSISTSNFLQDLSYGARTCTLLCLSLSKIFIIHNDLSIVTP